MGFSTEVGDPRPDENLTAATDAVRLPSLHAVRRRRAASTGTMSLAVTIPSFARDAAPPYPKEKWEFIPMIDRINAYFHFHNNHLRPCAYVKSFRTAS